MSSDIDKSVDRLGFEPAGVVPLGGISGLRAVGVSRIRGKRGCEMSIAGDEAMELFRGEHQYDLREAYVRGREAEPAAAEIEDRMLKSREAARMIGISPRTLAKWRQRGVGPQCVRLGYNLVVYRLSDIGAWIREHGVE